MQLLFIIVVVTTIPALLEVQVIEDNVIIGYVICPEQVQHVSEHIFPGIIVPADKQNIISIFYHKGSVSHKSCRR